MLFVNHFALLIGVLLSSFHFRSSGFGALALQIDRPGNCYLTEEDISKWPKDPFWHLNSCRYRQGESRFGGVRTGHISSEDWKWNMEMRNLSLGLGLGGKATPLSFQSPELSPISTSPRESKTSTPVEPSTPVTPLSESPALTPSSKSTSIPEEDGFERGAEVEGLVGRLTGIYGRMQLLEDLRPSPEVNGVFGDLVRLCIEPVEEDVSGGAMNDERVTEILPRLRSTCSAAEYELESHWAEKIASQENAELTQQILATFPYNQNYIDLTRLELSSLLAIEPNLSNIRKIAFIGSGPLPLTSLQLLEELNSDSGPFSRRGEGREAEVLNIDFSQKAIELSSDLCASLGPDHHATGMRFLQADATNLPEGLLKDSDVVFLAALVGNGQQEKETVLRKVVGELKEGTLVVVRSVRGLRGVLYPEFDVTTKGVREVLDVGAVVHPYGDVVNSVVVGRAKGRKPREVAVEGL